MKYIASKDMSLIEALEKLSPESSKTTLRSWLKEGRVTINGEAAKLSSTPILEGQEISLKARPVIIDEGIRILYEDKHLVVIDKPEGLLSVATNFEKGKTAHGILKDYYRPRKRVFVVHRLDQETSGIMLFALSEESRDKLKKIFEEHAIEREYYAIVEGTVKQPKGKWESFLFEDERYHVHSTNDPVKGQKAISHYVLKAYSSRYSALAITLETGRKNQIRVHCQEAGHPVVGDKKYGAKSNPIKRLCLHARLLAFAHPILKKPMRFESSLPENFERLV